MKSRPTSEELIASCGMNCAVCSRYLAQLNNLKRSGCKGCRVENKKCTYLFAKCEGINNTAEGTRTASFCFECDQYPCRQLKRMDSRYRKSYGMSVMDNLEQIEKGGVQAFAREQHKKHGCPKCGEFISVHNGKCFQCDTIARLVDKQTPTGRE